MSPSRGFPNLVARTAKAFASSVDFLLGKVSAYRGYFVRAVLIGLVISVTVTLLAWVGYFRPYQNPLTDLLHLVTQKKANDVVLLFITEEEYKEGFRGVSPLSRGRLAELVNLIRKLGARVIALDIDLSDPSFEDDKLLEAFDRCSTAGIPVVVVGNLKALQEKPRKKDDSPADLRPYPEESVNTTRDGFVLFDRINPGSQWTGKVVYGGTCFRLDDDRVFRMAEAFYMIRNQELDPKLPYLPVPSFPVAVVAAYQGMGQEMLMEALLKAHDDKIVLSGSRSYSRGDVLIHTVGKGRVIPNFIGNYEHFDREVSLKSLLEEYRSSGNVGETIFKDKIVIIGGTFDYKDFHMTPVGWMSGTEILANITQSIISGNLITLMSFWKAFIMQVVLGVVVALIFILFSRMWATVICLAALIPGVAIASLLSFSSSYYWFDFVPTIAGVMIFERIRKAEQFFKKVKDKLEIHLAKHGKT